MICANRPQRATAVAGKLADSVPRPLIALLRLARLGLLSTTLFGVAFANPGGDAVFAEPTSGRPVSQYTVGLPVNGEQQRKFEIPAECTEVNRLFEERRADTTRVVDRRLWGKVSEDCWFHAFLNRHPFRSIEDFVTGYDFKNARLSDLPIDLGCAGVRPDKGLPGCNPAKADRHGLLRHFPLSVPEDIAPDHPTPGDCQLRDGVFYGRLSVGPDGMHCDSGHAEPSLRLITVDFADINGDGFLDAVLRFVPVGPGVARSPLILPLTRTRADGPFIAPDGM